MHEDSLKLASKVFQRIYETCLKGNTENIYFSIIPDKNYFLQDDDSALTMDYDNFFQTMQDANPQMHYIDIAPLLELTDYYQTDPHWRQEKIIDVANHLADSMGTFVSDDFQEQIFTNDFRGAYAGQTAQNLSGEPLCYLTSPTIEQCTVFDHQNNRQISMYDFVKGDGKDPYELFLSGSLSYITIEILPYRQTVNLLFSAIPSAVPLHLCLPPDTKILHCWMYAIFQAIRFHH